MSTDQVQSKNANLKSKLICNCLCLQRSFYGVEQDVVK